MERAEVGGLNIAYERAGAGPPLMLLHGFVGDGTTTWRHQMDGLSSDFTVLAWDAPGAGSSSDPPESFGISGYADCLAAFLAELGFEAAHVGGLSFGGALAIALAQRHPTVPRSLILISAYAGWAGSLPPDEVERRLQQSLVLSRLGPEEFVETLLPTMFRASASESDVSTFAAAIAAFHPAGFRAMATASAEDLAPGLSEIDVPTLLLYGEQDVRAPRYVAEHLRSGIRGSRLVFLPDAGHLCTIEAPSLLNEEIRSFLLTFPRP